MATACNPRNLEGVIRGTGFTIQGEAPGSNGIVSQFQLEFKRELNRIYDLSSPSFYYIEGAPQGTATFQKIVGPKGAPKLLCSCEPNTVILNTGTGTCYPTNTAAADTSYTLHYALPFGLSGQGQATDFIVSFSVSYLFSDLT
jgi:hypothetical protein